MTPSSLPGKIEISRQAIATLVAETVRQCYGVVGLAEKTKMAAWRRNLPGADPAHQGIEVILRDGAVTVDVFIIVAYGTRISEVARSVMQQVQYTLTQTTGLPVAAVNVHVQDLRVHPSS